MCCCDLVLFFVFLGGKIFLYLFFKNRITGAVSLVAT